jgi:hypothetical protein
VTTTTAAAAAGGESSSPRPTTFLFGASFSKTSIPQHSYGDPADDDEARDPPAATEMDPPKPMPAHQHPRRCPQHRRRRLHGQRPLFLDVVVMSLFLGVAAV